MGYNIPMMIVKIYNNKSFIVNEDHPDGKVDSQYQEAIRKHLAYEVPSAEWSNKFLQVLQTSLKPYLKS